MNKAGLENLKRVVRRGKEIQDQIENCEGMLENINKGLKGKPPGPYRFSLVANGHLGYGKSFTVKIDNIEIVKAAIQGQLQKLTDELTALTPTTEIPPDPPKPGKKAPKYEEDEEYEDEPEEEDDT